jgi:hypothetical protein
VARRPFSGQADFPVLRDRALSPVSTEGLRANEGGHQIRAPPTPALAARGDKGGFMLILGLILLILGFVLSIPVLWTIGIVLLVIGAVLFLLGSTGRAVGGRRHWY